MLPSYHKNYSFGTSRACCPRYPLLNRILQALKEPPRVCAVHLRVVELERNRKLVTEKPLFVPPPYQKRIVENAAVHAHRAVKLRVDDCRSADDHALGGQVKILALLGNLRRVFEVVAVERFQVVRKRNVAGTDLAVLVLDDGVGRVYFFRYSFLRLSITICLKSSKYFSNRLSSFPFTKVFFPLHGNIYSVSIPLSTIFPLEYGIVAFPFSESEFSASQPNDKYFKPLHYSIPFRLCSLL